MTTADKRPAHICDGGDRDPDCPTCGSNTHDPSNTPRHGFPVTDQGNGTCLCGVQVVLASDRDAHLAAEAGAARAARYAEALYGTAGAHSLARSVAAGEQGWGAEVRAIMAVADSELGQLRAGEDATPREECAWPTPGQAWHELLEMDPVIRLGRLKWLFDAAGRVDGLRLLVDELSVVYRTRGLDRDSHRVLERLAAVLSSSEPVTAGPENAVVVEEWAVDLGFTIARVEGRDAAERWVQSHRDHPDPDVEQMPVAVRRTVTTTTWLPAGEVTPPADPLPEELANPELVEALRATPPSAYSHGVRETVERIKRKQYGDPARPTTAASEGGED